MSRGSRFSQLIPIVVTLLALFLAQSLPAQIKINGVPASVTSLGFGGNPGPQGVPASVTSLGFGQVRHFSPFFNEPNCCINPLFPRHPKRRFFDGGRNRFRGGLPIYSTPYYYPVPIVEPVDDTMENSYGPGPTIFDRRGSERTSLAYERGYDDRVSRLEKLMDAAEARPKDLAPAEEKPAKDQPATVLVFRDGHSAEVRNYAIVGDTLFDFSTDRRKKIALADLDLVATQKQNEDRGVDFRLPGHSSGN